MVSLLMNYMICHHARILFGPDNAEDIASNGWIYNSVVSYYEDNQQPGWIGIWSQGFISKTINTIGYDNITFSLVPGASINYPLENNDFCIVSYRIPSDSNDQTLFVFSDDDLRTLYRRQVVNIALPVSTYNANSLTISVYNNGSIADGLSNDICYFRMLTLYGDKIVTKAPTIKTETPTKVPTYTPTINSHTPTISSTTTPSIKPTLYPTIYPTIKPTLYPSQSPTIEPTIIANVLNLTTTITEEISSNYTQNSSILYPTNEVNVPNTDGKNTKLETAIIIIVLALSVLIPACTVALLIVIVHQQKIENRLKMKQEMINKLSGTQMVRVTSTTNIDAEQESSIVERRQTRSNSGEISINSDIIIGEAVTEGNLPPKITDYKANAIQLVSYYID